MNNRILWTSALLLGTAPMLLTGCRSNTVPAPGEAPIVDGSASANDPAAANMAYVAAGGQYAGQAVTRVAANSYAAVPQQSAESYPQQAQQPYPAQGNSQQNEAYQYNTQQPAYQGDPNQAPPPAGYDPNQSAASAAEYDAYSDLLDPNVPQAEQAPPPLPDNYDQPEAPGPDYQWTPGYWDYANTGYYYVPGAWVASPYVGALWTPGWWGYYGRGYRFHHGYWGPHVGYYGGINYGFGYVGFGYQGGYWNNDHFWYNRSVLRVNPRYVNNNVYQRNVTVMNRTYVNNSRVSYFGGPGGLRRGPAPQEFAAHREQRTPPMAAQIANRREAEGNRSQFFNQNKGRPQMAFASRALPADRGIQAPPRNAQNGFGNVNRGGFGQPGNAGGRPGFNGQQGQPASNMRPAPVGNSPQFQQQRQQNEQQRGENLQQRGQNLQQRDQNLQQRDQNLQQRQQIEQQRGQPGNQQQQQQNLQRNQQEQQRVQQEQQRNQQGQQRNQQMQQQNAQRQQQQEQQRNQQQNMQRQQQEQQRQQQTQQLQQRNQQEQQRAQQEQQRGQQMQQQQAQRQQQMQQQQAQRQQQQQQHVQQQQHMEAPRPAPAPRAEAPHGGGEGGGHHH